jgi:hypothetical protein
MTRLNLQIRQWFNSARGVILWALLCGLILGLTASTHAASQDRDMASGEMAYAIAGKNRLVQFSTADTCTILSSQSVTGLQNREKLVGIDFRPATGQLYGLGSTSRLYVIDPQTAVATQVGTPFSTPLSGLIFGFDFNPTVDRIRVVSNTRQNLRLHPDTGAVAAVDTDLAYAATDPNAGTAPLVVGAAYTNPDNDPNTGTTLYDLDGKLDILTIQNPPNDGTLNTIGSLGTNINYKTGFDISISGVAYAAVVEAGASGGCGASSLVSIDLTTGNATSLGYIGTSSPIGSLAIAMP